MSVYIPGMEMPTSCCECPLTYYEDGTCIFTGIDALSIGVQKDCPLVPVPPHGRLIDADALVRDNGIKEIPEYYEVVCAAPTIIPADPAEEGE